MRLFKLNTTVHKWLSLVVGMQLLIWLVTGLYFNLMDESKASGNANRIYAEQVISNAEVELIALSDIDVDSPIEVKLIWIQAQPYYQFIFEQGEHSYQKRRSILFNAVTGQEFSLSKQQALTLAQQSYSGTGRLMTTELTQPPFADDVKQQNAMWKIDVEDENMTTIYLDSVTGQVLRHVNDDARLKDLMLKLHFMDYADSGGFNHWLIIAFAIATLLLSITGITWLIQHYRHGLLSFNRSRKNKKLR
ncbi:PepSY domain-containing protein [Thalassotalea ganghwensis]